VAPNGAQFTLAADPDKDWLKWSPKIPVISTEAGVNSQTKPGILNDFIRQ
jgi:hypothetical protein